MLMGSMANLCLQSGIPILKQATLLRLLAAAMPVVGPCKLQDTGLQQGIAGVHHTCLLP